MLISPQDAAKILPTGEIIAYPTEAVYGLGCDPFNEKAVNKLLQLKHRDVAKGLLLIAASWSDVEFLVDKNKLVAAADKLQQALATWPGPVTWVFPASPQVPKWIKGRHETIALRLTAHPAARAICHFVGGPIVSTSANIADLPPARTRSQLLNQFDDAIKYIVKGRVGNLKKPTAIYDVLTGTVLR